MTRLEEIKERVEKLRSYRGGLYRWTELYEYFEKDLPYLLALVEKQREALENAKARDQLHLQALSWLESHYKVIDQIPGQSIEGWINNRQIVFNAGLIGVDLALNYNPEGKCDVSY